RQSDVYAAAIRRISSAGDVTLPFESIDPERHRCGRDTHMAGEVVDGGRIDLVEMVEDARLMAAYQPLRIGITDVPRMAGEVDLRIQRQDLSHGFQKAGHGERQKYTLLWQSKLK